jgi:hypothetical protein
VINRSLLGIFGYPSGAGDYYLCTSYRPTLGLAQPFIQKDTGFDFPGVRLSEREPGHSSPSSTKVQNEYNYNSIPPHAFIKCIGITLYYFLCEAPLLMSGTAYYRLWNFVNNSLSLAVGFKPGILCSLEMVRFYRNMSELRV